MSLLKFRNLAHVCGKVGNNVWNFFFLGSFHKEKYSKEGYLSVGRAKGNGGVTRRGWRSMAPEDQRRERPSKRTKTFMRDELVTHFSGDMLILESGGIFPNGSVPYWDYASGQWLAS